MHEIDSDGIKLNAAIFSPTFFFFSDIFHLFIASFYSAERERERCELNSTHFHIFSVFQRYFLMRKLSFDVILFISFQVKDQYGNEVSRLARPLPVEYLLVDVPASTPLQPIYTFTARETKEMFPVENRYIDGQLQDFNALSVYISKWAPNEFLEAISDFHLLLYLYFMDMLPMKSAMGPLLEAVRTKNFIAAEQWKEQEVWSTLETLITASSSASG